MPEITAQDWVSESIRHSSLWAEPSGAILGAVPLPGEAGDRFGHDWAEVTWQGGRVWVRVSDALGLEIASLPDLRPPTPAPIVIAAPPAAVQVAPVEPTTDRTHARSVPDDRGPPTSVPAFTVR